MTERKLPVGIQSFEDLRTNGYVYVDKTQYIWDLVETGKSYFLSRPRRFGKSLLVSTLEAYFLGKKELFQGLKIETLENGKGEEAWQRYPVITFSLSGGYYADESGMDITLDLTLSRVEEQYGLTSEDGFIQANKLDLPNRFRYVIERLYKKCGRKVVILVDEYDKPLLETMDTNPQQEEKNRRIYKGFFSVLKDEDQYLKFVFFTGVTKFSKVSVFSDLNQLNDISLDDEVSGICGITEQEMRENFRPEVDRLADNLKISETECMSRLAKMYDGYRFSPAGVGVYNPFSLLKAFRSGRMRRYWYETGTPGFLLKKLGQTDFTPEKLTDGVEIAEQDLMDYRTDNPDPIPLLYQTGYLTICGYDEDFQIYELRFPNDEVRYGFLNSLAPYVLGYQDTEKPLSVRNMVRNLEDGDVDSFFKELTALFAGIPYAEGKAPEYEREWRNQIYLILTMLGQSIRCEVHSARGRADCIIETKKYIYILELKLDGSANEALKQIEEKGYALPYIADGREIITIGVNFSSKLRNIKEWKENDRTED